MLFRSIGCIQMSGCALGPWFEFFDANRKAVESKCVSITRGEKDDTGGVEFVPPLFAIRDISPETDEAAKKLDVELQSFLTAYFARSQSAPSQPGASNQAAPSDDHHTGDAAADAEAAAQQAAGDDCPF